jgi:threonine aldolase
MAAPEIIDLRSDTVTKPTPEMRQAMATCEVGDDVFNDDPTVNELEKRAAEAVGTEASLWCPTGSMANQVSISTHTIPGQEVIAGDGSHIVNFEVGGVAWLSQCQLRTVSDEIGWVQPDSVRDTLRGETMHTPGTGLVCLENTHNLRGGRIMPLEDIVDSSIIAHENGVPVHLDGARIWNASTASGIPVKDYVKHVDSVMFCLSKGLGSPAGSMLCGKKDFIAKARRIRKKQGGGMRQAGVLAACGLISLDAMTKRLADDHKAAKDLSIRLLNEGLLKINPDSVETNICMFTPPESASWTNEQFAKSAKQNGLLVTFLFGNRIRMVTHNDYKYEWIDETIARVKKAISGLQ